MQVRNILSIDAAKSESPSSGGIDGNNDVVITFAFMPAARWRLRQYSVYGSHLVFGRLVDVEKPSGI